MAVLQPCGTLQTCIDEYSIQIVIPPRDSYVLLPFLYAEQVIVSSFATAANPNISF